jgi:hypothetical protein
VQVFHDPVQHSPLESAFRTGPTSATELHPNEAPPPDYYAANLRLLLTHVLELHRDLLEPATEGFARDLLAASSDAQRLFARLVSRKGPWFRIDKLVYGEVGDREGALAELAERDILAFGTDAPADALLRLLTSAERQTLFPEIGRRRRSDWIDACVTRHTDAAVRGRVGAVHPWVCLRHPERFELCQLLFFGDDHQDTSAFVLRDLGMTRYPDYELLRSHRMFATRNELASYLRLKRLRALSHRLAEHAGLATYLSDQLWVGDAPRHERRQRDRLLNRLGRHFERAGDVDAALSCYARSCSHPARERQVRMLDRLGDGHGAAKLLEGMRRAPRAAEEEDFAIRFGARRLGQRTRRPAPAQSVVGLAGAAPARIEDHAASLLTAAGGEAWHLENHLPMTLAGLAYWDVVLAPLKGVFVNPFQSGPLDLFWEDFAANRRGLIAARDAQLSRPGRFRAEILDTYSRHHGIANGLVRWRAWSPERLQCLLDCVAEEVLWRIARHVIRQPYRARNGFPDLVVIYGPGSYEFVEVKGPNDQLQPAQRIWLKTLSELGAPARVLKFTV